MSNQPIYPDTAGMAFGNPTPKKLIIHAGDKAIFSITGTPTGFDVEVPDGVTMTECAKAFVGATRDYLRELKL